MIHEDVASSQCLQRTLATNSVFKDILSLTRNERNLDACTGVFQKTQMGIKTDGYQNGNFYEIVFVCLCASKHCKKGSGDQRESKNLEPHSGTPKNTHV